MRGQALVGVFLILIGILIFVYWIILPASEKEKLLEELYNESYNVSYISISNSQNQEIEINNIILSKEAIEYIIADKYLVGNLIEEKKIKFKDFELSSNIFSGSSYVSFVFPFVDGEGVYFKFMNKCTNCKVKIIINNNTIFEGVPNERFSIFIPNKYLVKQNTLKVILEPPLNPFISAKIKAWNVQITYVRKNSLSTEFYYENGDIFLEYDFCPTNPSLVKLYINSKKINLPTCSSYMYNTYIILTNYLKKGINIIKVETEVPTNISLKLKIKNPKFFKIFDKPNKGIIYLFIEKGNGILEINNCTFYLSPDTSIINIGKCLSDKNIMIIEANPHIEIQKIIIT